MGKINFNNHILKIRTLENSKKTGNEKIRFFGVFHGFDKSASFPKKLLVINRILNSHNIFSHLSLIHLYLKKILNLDF